MKDQDKENRLQQWHYKSVIGMMMFLAGTTRPDISFAVHQCARFSQNPMRSHEEAVKRIGRYLKATADIGLVLKPNGSNRLTASADADFAGSWNFKNSDEASSVLSRSGYLIMFSNCPILWVSKMQSEIALSTTEAEYICLSQCIRDLIPIRTIIKELAPILNMEISYLIIK